MLFYGDLAEYVTRQTEKLERLSSANIPEVGVILDLFGPADNQDMNANPGLHSVTRPVERLAIDCHGVHGDRHRGLTRSASVRESRLYKKSGARIVNRRQIFAVSPHECDLLSTRLGVEITPQLLGANVVIGRDDGTDYSISDVPQNTYFVIAPADAAEPPGLPIATLIQYLQQKGCARTGRAITRRYGDPSLTKRFVANAEHHRGILCSVEYPVDSIAFLERGQKVFFKFPMGSCY